MTPLSPSEQTGRTVAAIVLLLSAIGAAIPFLTTDSVASFVPGSGSGSGPRGGSSGEVGVPGTATTRPASAFPVYPGAKRYHGDYVSAPQKAWTVTASLKEVKSFYDDMLADAGFEWGDLRSTTAPNGKVLSWSGNLTASDGDSFGYLSIADGGFTGRLGTIAIRVSLP